MCPDKPSEISKNKSYIKGTTRIVGIFGDPVSHTLSPKMHNYAFAQLNLDYVYVPFLVKPEDLQGAVESLKLLNFAGVNVTIPHKKAVMKHLDSLSSLAEHIGAVNTIINRDGKLHGDNTDAPGFMTSLTEDAEFRPQDKSVVLFGAGGVAHAMAVPLLEAGIKKLSIFDKIHESACALEKHLKSLFPGRDICAPEISPENIMRDMKTCELLVSAAPGGVDHASLNIPPEKFLSPKILVFNAVYGKETLLEADAKKAGARYLDGLGMLVRQGAISFSLWTGAKPPVNLMKKALEI